MTVPATAPVQAVLDTNIVLDLLVFQDARAAALHSTLQSGALHWVATPPMREELLRVLQYAHIAKHLQARSSSADVVLAQFDALAAMRPIPVKAPLTCKDPDDQKFIDLAVAHTTQLWSKDHAIICLRKRLLAQGVIYCAWP